MDRPPVPRHLPLPLAVSSICSSINVVDCRSGLQASSFKITSPRYCSRPLDRIHFFRIQLHLPIQDCIAWGSDHGRIRRTTNWWPFTFAASGIPQLRTWPEPHHISSFSALEHVPPLAPS